MIEPSDTIIYLDNAATTFPKPECVYQAADEFYRRFGGNAGRGANPLARQGTELINETRVLVASWLGVPSPEQVIFTPSATIALNLAIFGARLRPGDAVYVTPFEHNSVLRPLEHLRQTINISIDEIPFQPRTMTCDLNKLEAMFRVNPPAMVCATQASNVCGVMPPLTEIFGLSRKIQEGCITIVDGAQTAGLYPLDLKNGLIDALIFSGHKSMYGPYGIAGLVLPDPTRWRPAPFLFGGTGTVSESVEMPDILPSAYEAGSQNIYAMAGLRAALGWLQDTERETIATCLRSIALQLREVLEDVPGVTLYAPDAKMWAGILAFTLDSTRPQAVEMALGAAGIAVRAGLHCAPWAHRWLGTIDQGGAVRISAGFYNSPDDIDLLLSVLNRL